MKPFRFNRSKSSDSLPNSDVPLEGTGERSPIMINNDSLNIDSQS